MRHVRVCGCSHGCAKPHKSQQCGLSLHRRKFFLARFEHFPSTASTFRTEQQRREILMMASAEALWGASRSGGSVPHSRTWGAGQSPPLPRLGADPALRLWGCSPPSPRPVPSFPHPRPSFSVLGEHKLIFSCASPEGFFHYTGRAELPARPLARLPRLQPLAPLFQRHIVQM